ncbi:hypothetical protein ACFYY2_29655 [Streptomyces sp. NPDC001822]|uniref:hypothetical protein n=1 Tax=Streptomyces sp. NPDC001822 TaxID=3364614 RepID=UPI0036B3013B
MSNALTSRKRRIDAAAAVDKAVLYTSISAGMVLARRYLTGRGIDQGFADQYGSPFGRTAAKIYRSETGTEPRKAWSNVHGKWRRVNGFLPAETDVLDKAFLSYKRTAEYVAPAPAVEPGPAEVYVKATAGYAARFEGLTGDMLRDLETEHGTDEPGDRVRPLLDTLANWKRHLDRFEATVTDADERAVQGLTEDDPRRVAWRAASTGVDAFLKAQAAVHGAYVDWAFDLTGDIEIVDTPRPAAPVVPAGCRIPGCDQRWHYDALCVAELGELPFDDGSSLPVELSASEGKPTSIVAFAFEPRSMNLRREITTQADAAAFAKALRDAADAVDDAAQFLATA